MGKISNLTPEQEKILDEIKKIDFFREQFYFTGGTALSLVYFQHRFSDDLDFFSQDKFDNQVIFTLMSELSKKANFSLQANFAEVVYIFNLTFANGNQLKVDFGYYPYKQLESPQVVDGLKVDSLQDIAVNKLLTVTQRNDVKDLVDLYFLLDKFTLFDLIEGVRIKFGLKLEPILLASDFLKIEECDFLPKMIKQVDLEQLKRFFRQKSQALAGKSLS